MLENQSSGSGRYLEKEICNASGEVQLKHFNNFLNDFSNRLAEFEASFPPVRLGMFGPVAFETKFFENVTLLQLVHSDNRLLRKILATLASMCLEVKSLTAEAREEFYPKLLYYSEETNFSSARPQGLNNMSKMLETLQRLSLFVGRIHDVLNLFLLQLSALTSKETFPNRKANFADPVDHLADLLVCLVILENLLSFTSLQNDWLAYKKVVRGMVHGSERFSIPVKKLSFLDKVLDRIDGQLMSRSVFQNALNQCLQSKVVAAVKRSGIANELVTCMHNMLTELETDSDRMSHTQIWLQVNVIFVLHFHLTGSSDKKVQKRLVEINRKATAWLIQLEAALKDDPSELEYKQLQKICDLLVDGLKLAKQMGEMAKWIPNVHTSSSKPMAKSVALAVCRLVELLKGIQWTFQVRARSIVQCTFLLTQYTSHQALVFVAALQRNSIQEKTYDNQHLDVISALNVCERALAGPPTQERILVARLALATTDLGQSNAEIYGELRGRLARLELLQGMDGLLSNICDCSFLYWHDALVGLYLDSALENKSDISRMKFMLSAFTNCAAPLKDRGYSPLGRDEREFATGYLEPLCQAVETNLRLQVHSHLELDVNSPFTQPVFENQIFLEQPFRFMDKYLCVKYAIERDLSATFYNLTTVVLQDWKTYCQMRKLAHFKHGLDLIEDHLPMQTLEQGLDVLEIMRNIDAFVSGYLYNMNNQVFVEKQSNNKHLNTINITHVANSIRTHGLGIMNTTVNFTYQFLQKKFFILSQFINDELVKSRLMREWRFLSDSTTDSAPFYPYERAEKVCSEMKKLSSTGNVHRSLDLFRELIDQIGNAMGYVRMIRSGGRRCLADATSFLPSLKSESELATMLSEEHESRLVSETAEGLRHDLKVLTDNFAEATEYFKLLVNVFTPVFKNPENSHLRNFFLIIPALTINFVEHSLMSKERLNKKNKDGSAFTDDGFAMGLAFIIKLLQQVEMFKSLHWFQSVRTKFTKDLEQVERQRDKANREDVKFQQTLTLTEKRICIFDKEFKLLNYNLSSARMFFQ